MLPRLQAEERLNRISDIGVGTGSMERDDQRDITTALRREAGLQQARPAKASGADLAAMGIAIRAPAAPSQEGVSDG
jgi:hypothetical protein